MTSNKNYDDLLYPILCSEGNIFGFFNGVFDFLDRKTDYFKIKKDDSSTTGLELGEAENILRKVFSKYMERAMIKYESEKKEANETVCTDYVVEEVVSATEQVELYNRKKDSVVEAKGDDEANDVNSSDNPDQQSDPKQPWMDPDCYNGARYEDYCWAQSLTDVDIRIKVPKHVTTGKQVKVNLCKSSVSAEMVSEGAWQTLKKGELSWKMNVEESTWTLVPGEHIHICLQKLEPRWWKRFFVDEPEIDIKSIDPSMPFEDLDEESQAKINELMYNQHQKRLGKPTIQQNKIQNILKEAWNSEGSPFKGQPYDPSIVDVQNADSLS